MRIRMEKASFKHLLHHGIENYSCCECAAACVGLRHLLGASAALDYFGDPRSRQPLHHEKEVCRTLPKNPWNAYVGVGGMEISEELHVLPFTPVIQLKLSPVCELS